MLAIKHLFAKIFGKSIGLLSHWVDVAFGQFMLGFAIIVVAFGAVVFITIGNGWANLLKALNITPNITVFDTRTIVNSVKPMGDLVSISEQYATADVRVDIRGGLGGACNQWAQYAYIVEIQAGTDLTNIKASDISFDKETESYTITLPPPRLTSCNVYDNFSRYRFHEPAVSDAICQSYEKEYTQFGEYQVIELIREQALSSGILDRAVAENDQTLSGFFSAVLNQTVNIEYKEQEPEHAINCYPEISGGWLLNTENNGTVFWTRQ